MKAGRVRFAISLLGCSAIVWVATHQEATYAAVTSARRLLGESDDVKAAPSPKLRGTEVRLQSSGDNVQTAPSTESLATYYYRNGVWYRDDTQQTRDTKRQWRLWFFLQFIYGLVFYFLVAVKYPRLQYATPESASIMNEPTACRIKCGPICLQSFLCPGPMLAHLLQATGGSNYWGTLIVSLLCPVICPYCAVFCATEVSQVNFKLGGVQKGCVINCIEAFLCSPCVIAQSNEALDAATGMELGCCTAVHSAEPVHDAPVAIGLPPAYQASAPYQAMPQQAMQYQALPVQAVPAQAMPDQATPYQAMPQ